MEMERYSGSDVQSEDEFHDALEDFEQVEMSRIPGVETKYQPPSEDQQKKIMERLHFYFSDERLAKDVFMRKRIERSKERYVTAQFVISLKKLKGLAKDPRDIEHSLKTQGSELLHLDPSGSKLRRFTQFVASKSTGTKSETQLSPENSTWENRTVLVSSLPNDRKTVDSIQELLSRCGTVVSVELTNPNSNLKGSQALAAKTYRCLKFETCAFVEFARAADAKNAVETLDQRKSDWRGLCVTSLQRNCIDDVKRTRRITEGDDSDYFSSGSVDSSRRKSPPGMSIPERVRAPLRKTSFSDDSCDSLSTSPKDTSSMKKASPLQMSWVQQRRFLIPGVQEHIMLPVSILRNPRGPDGSRGFRDFLFNQNTAILCN